MRKYTPLPGGIEKARDLRHRLAMATRDGLEALDFDLDYFRTDEGYKEFSEKLRKTQPELAHERARQLGKYTTLLIDGFVKD